MHKRSRRHGNAAECLFDPHCRYRFLIAGQAACSAGKGKHARNLRLGRQEQDAAA